MISTLLQIIGGGGIALLLLLGQQGLQAILNALQQGQPLAAVAPWAIAIALLAGIESFVAAVQRERQEILGELVQRHIQEHVLEVSAAVDLLAFETPAFHNRVQRMQVSSHQPLNMVFGLSGLLRAAIGIVAVLVTLITIEPFLVLMVSIVFVPAWLSASRRGEAFWRFLWRTTPRDRERHYLAQLLTDRDEAKEIRRSILRSSCALDTASFTTSALANSGRSRANNCGMHSWRTWALQLYSQSRFSLSAGLH
jgi:ATP-binding cassette, subfamily B, bacterial